MVSKQIKSGQTPNRRASVTAVDPQTLSVERPPTANAAPRFQLHFIQLTGVPSLPGSLCSPVTSALRSARVPPTPSCRSEPGHLGAAHKPHYRVGSRASSTLDTCGRRFLLDLSGTLEADTSKHPEMLRRWIESSLTVLYSSIRVHFASMQFSTL